MVADKGYHGNDVLEMLADEGCRTYISEPERGRRKWKNKECAKKATYGNRRRIRGKRGKGLLRRRGELLERPFAHYLEAGGMRRTHLRGHENILKRLLVHVAAFDLGILMRWLLGAGTPRELASKIRGVLGMFLRLYGSICLYVRRVSDLRHEDRVILRESSHTVPFTNRRATLLGPRRKRPFSTGC